MCAIIGYYSEAPNSEDNKFISKLVQESKIRGLHSFGFAYKDTKDRIKLVKEFSFDRKTFPETNMLMAHARYSTSGDWKEKENNQPIEYNNNYIAFNGVINMGTKKEMEKEYKISMESNNDAEVFLHLCKILEPEDVVERLNCSFAGVFILNGRIYCHRNSERPLWRVVINKSVFLASTKDIFERCGIKGSMPVEENTTY